MARKGHSNGGGKKKLTPEVTRIIVDVIRAGNFRDVAAQAAGVSPSLFYQWWARKGEPYATLRAAVLEAETTTERAAVAAILVRGKKDPIHLRWWLERKFPERWGRKRIEVTGPDGGPVEIDVRTLSDAEIDQLCAGNFAAVATRGPGRKGKAPEGESEE